MKHGKRGKRVPQSREAAQAFWACALHEGQGTNGLRPLPERFESPAAYFAGLSTLVLAEAKAIINVSLRKRWGGPQNAVYGAVPAVVTQITVSGCNKVAKQRFGVTGRLVNLTVKVEKAPYEWPTLRTAWLVELHMANRAAPMPFFVERAASGRQDFSVDLCGFASHHWGWHDEQRVLVEAPISINLRPLEDMVPLLRMWTACFIAPQVPFLHQLLGAKSATHRVFSDSEDDVEDTQAVDADDAAEGEAISDGPSMEHLNTLQQEAVRKILSESLPRRCHLLQGPPGTGKTRAVIALLQQLSARQVANSWAEPRNRILVSAPSNGAVQVALENFLKTQEGQRSSLCLVGVEDRVPVDGPIRAAFIHTRLQYTLALLLKAQKDPSMLPQAVQALESLESCAPSVFHRLKLPNDKSRWASVNALQKILELGTSTTSVPTVEDSDSEVSTSTTRSESSDIATTQRREIYLESTENMS
eukprot:symbB.v1.2.016490.t1/scaffold1254.1/size128712/4